VVLPLVLMILILLGLLVASFAFRVHADESGMTAVAYRLQTRLAAEAGIEKVLLMLRTQRENIPAWYNNPEELNRIIVWTPGDDRTLWGSKQELDEGTPAYRFSIVADDPFDDKERCRYGITDEAGKLNINTATAEQLGRLIGQIATPDMVVEELVDALLDWRDVDNDPLPHGAEADYYAGLKTPYQPKSGPFDTVEELLLVRGFDGRVLYGEDYNRNGILDPNEDDGDDSFPPDDGDGVLNRGLLPYITVVSRDFNTDHTNRPRAFLYGDQALLRTELAKAFEDQTKIDFIVRAVSRSDSGGGGPGRGGGRGRGRPTDGQDRGEGKESRDPNRDRGGRGNQEPAPSDTKETIEEQPDAGTDGLDGSAPRLKAVAGWRSGGGPVDADRQSDATSKSKLQARPGAEEDPKPETSGGRDGGRRPGRGADRPGRGDSGGDDGRGGAGGERPGRGADRPGRGDAGGGPGAGGDDGGSRGDRPGREGRRPRQGRRPGTRTGPGAGGGGVTVDDGEENGEEGEDVGTDGADEGTEDSEGQGDPTSQPGGEPARLRGPADLLTVVLEGDSPAPNPLTVDDLPVLMDKLTAVDPAEEQPGLIDIMTAPPQVLRCLTDLTGEQIGAILETRVAVLPDDAATTAWLVTQQVLDLETYQKVAPLITSRGRQFTIESIGYADHIGTVCRLQVVVEIRGPMGQVLYERDLTKLGSVFPIRKDEEEFGFGGHNG